MRAVVLLTFSFLVLIVSSCAYWKAYTIPMEDRVLDSWKYEEALFRKNLTLTALDETEQYLGIIITFKEDNSVLIHTSLNDKGFEGKWRLEKYNESMNDEGENQGPQYSRMIISFKDTVNEPVEWVWERFSLNREGIKCIEWRSDGHHSYKLVRNR